MFSSIDACYYKLATIRNLPICAFDFDDTLVKLHETTILPNVLDILSSLIVTHDIVIFSNQMGISKNKTTHEEVQSRFKIFLESIPNISIFYSTNDDMYRKPMTGMYDLFRSMIDHQCVEYFCGDAAGRKTDFSISDLYFANNCKIQFKSPEEIFQDKSMDVATKSLKSLNLYEEDVWTNGRQSNIRNLSNISRPNLELAIKAKTMIIMVGPQASGKSTLAKYLSDKYKLNIINNDVQGSKVNKIFKEYLKSESNGIIIDNTNPQSAKRNEWFQKVPDDWHKLIIWIDIPKPVSIHMMKNRMQYGGNKMSLIPIHCYYKRFEPPTDVEIVKIDNVISNYDIDHTLRFN